MEKVENQDSGLVARKLNLYKLIAEKALDDNYILKTGVYTFLSYYSIHIASKYNQSIDYSRFTRIGIDGIFLTKVYNFLGYKNIKRYSFDFGSIAKLMFEYLDENKLYLSVIGSTAESNIYFVRNVQRNYPNVHIFINGDGFFRTNERDALIDAISKQPNGLVLIGMGTKFQDALALEIWEKRSDLAIYTCGGFIHQSSETLQYYPNWVNFLHLRVFYRLLFEKGMLRKLIHIGDGVIYPLWLKIRNYY